jgi:hypothetical protein
VSVLLGNGAGGFGTARSFPAGDFPLSVAVGEFNGDGHPDLAVAANLSTGGSVVDVLLNQPGAAGVSALGGDPLTVPERHNPVVATFTDPTGAGFLGNYSATVTTNGLELPGTITFDPLTNVFSVAMPYLDPGTYALTITIDKAGSLSPPVTVFRQLTIVDPAVQVAGPFFLTATEGSPFTGDVAHFIDPGNGFAGDFAATIDWGDGSRSAGTITPAGVLFAAGGSHTYVRAGDYALSVRIRDEDSGFDQFALATATVDDAPLTPVARSVPFVAGQSLSRVVGSFADADPAGYAGLYTATIDWGDGTPTSPGTIAADGSGFDVTGNHTYATSGTRPITVTVRDTDGSSTVINSSAAIAEPPLNALGRNFAVTGHKSFSGAVATFTDPDPRTDRSKYTATIAWDDNTTSAGTITGSNPFTVSGSHTFGVFGGTHVVAVTVNDAPGGQDRTATVYDRVVDPPSQSPNGPYVYQLYQDLLGRTPDDAGLARWTNALDRGVSRQQVVAGITGSLEYRTRVVQQVYRTYLHRDADPRGLTTFTAYLAAGGTVEGVQARVAASLEYAQLHGGTDAGFLGALYGDALGRAIDATGQARWTQALSGGMTREAVAEAVFASLEYRQDLVRGDYQSYLRRPADDRDLASWVAAVRQGRRDEDVLTAIATSQEYLDRL